MSLQLQKVVERARQEPEGRFHSLAHLIDVPALETAYRGIRKGAAVGVDGVTKEDYGRDLEANLQDLHERLRSLVKLGRGQRALDGIDTVQDHCVEVQVEARR